MPVHDERGLRRRSAVQPRLLRRAAVSATRALLGALGAAALLVPASAQAQEGTPKAPEADVDRLGQFLEAAVRRDVDERIGGAIVDGAIAAALTPIGAVAVTRTDPGLQIAGVSFLMQAAVNLGAVLGDAFPSRAEELRDHYALRRAQGQNTVVAQTEQEWLDAIAATRGFRHAFGVIDLVLGLAETGLGAYALLASTSGNDRQEQTAAGVILVGVGASSIASGMGSFLFATSLERDWDLYRSAAPTIEPKTVPSVAIVPSPHGATGVVEVTF
jgi:hypothetical protein